jgi:hypothetical protein
MYLIWPHFGHYGIIFSKTPKVHIEMSKMQIGIQFPVELKVHQPFFGTLNFISRPPFGISIGWDLEEGALRIKEENLVARGT